ncbi:MAG TPA: hypothetical protein DCE39_14170 [Planctomycetaceae bacterium]|nr:hypothetical protein [Planctomycetaceae bacterium]
MIWHHRFAASVQASTRGCKTRTVSVNLSLAGIRIRVSVCGKMASERSKTPAPVRLIVPVDTRGPKGTKAVDTVFSAVSQDRMERWGVSVIGSAYVCDLHRWPTH